MTADCEIASRNRKREKYSPIWVEIQMNGKDFKSKFTFSLKGRKSLLQANIIILIIIVK